MKFAEFNEIIETNDQTEARHEHLEKIREIVGNVYPNKFERSKISGDEDTITNIVNFAPVTEIVKQLKDNTPEGEKPDQELKAKLNEKLKAFGNVRVSGRLAVPPRVMGKAAFVHLSDGINRLQIYVRKDDAKAIENMSVPSASAGGQNANESELNPEPPANAGGTDLSGWELFGLVRSRRFYRCRRFFVFDQHGRTFGSRRNDSVFIKSLSADARQNARHCRSRITASLSLRRSDRVEFADRTRRSDDKAGF